MSLSSRYSTSPIDECIYEPVTGSHDPRRNGDTGGHMGPEYRVHGLVSLTGARPPQSHAYPNRRLSDSIVNVQTGGFFNDDWHSAPTDWVYDLSAHAYQPLGSYPIKQSEYTVDMQGSFTDQPSSINNTRLYDLEEHHIDAHLGVPPPDYSESDGGWNLPLYDTDSYQSTSHCLLYSHPEQHICDNQYSPSNNLHEVHGYSKDQGSSQPNRAHVPPGMHIDTSTADSHGQHVGTSISLNLTMDHDCMMMLDHCESQSGCAGLPQLLHSERPPISSYSEFSAQMTYYDALNSSSSRQSKMPGSAAASVSVSVSASAPALALATASTGTGTGTGSGTASATSAAAQDSSRPLKRRDTGADWKQTPRSASSDKETQRPSQKRGTPPPPSKTAPLPFEAWTPPQPQSQSQSQSQPQSHSQSQSQSQSQPQRASKASDRVVVKHEERPSPPLSSRRKQQQSSPSSSRRSCSNESRRSRTLSPSSRSQGVLKTIMMKRGGSEQKKQNLACLFCRERKIACGRPAEGSVDPTCNQCLRRSLVCQYPTESRRGQHKRNAKKSIDSGHDVHRAK